jgi:NAD(P)-dependent dehydrogenase (short-subunit alcohol dehydrogenase family)
MNKVALVLGASRGIGRVICHKLAENGYNVVITAKSVEENRVLPIIFVIIILKSFFYCMVWC